MSLIRMSATDNAGRNQSHFYAVRRQQRSQSDVDEDAVTSLICDVTPIIANNRLSRWVPLQTITS